MRHVAWLAVVKEAADLSLIRGWKGSEPLGNRRVVMGSGLRNGVVRCVDRVVAALA
jgi:hypothetical protein